MQISRPGSPATPPSRPEDAFEAPKARRTQPLPRPSYLTSFIHWVQLKKYQYEVTYSLYMLTSTEKAIFSEFSGPFFFHLETFFSPGHTTKSNEVPGCWRKQ